MEKMRIISFSERYVAGPESNQRPLDPQSDSLSTPGDSAAIYTWAAACQNRQNGHCAQRRHRSAWVSAQSDQSLRCPYEETLGPQLPIERTAKTLIRLGGCTDWFEFSLGANSAGRFVEIWAAVCIFGVKAIYIRFLDDTYTLLKKKDVSNFFLPI